MSIRARSPSTRRITAFSPASGDGGIVKEGDGVLNLTGNSTYTGPTSVNGGILAVNGSIASNVTVNSGGKLGGNGAVGTTTVAAGGIVGPGNSIGRLTVNGDLDFAAGSTYEVEVNAGQPHIADQVVTLSVEILAIFAGLVDVGCATMDD